MNDLRWSAQQTLTAIRAAGSGTTASNSELAAAQGVGLSTIKRGLTELEGRGLLRIERAPRTGPAGVPSGRRLVLVEVTG